MISPEKNATDIDLFIIKNAPEGIFHCSPSLDTTLGCTDATAEFEVSLEFL